MKAAFALVRRWRGGRREMRQQKAVEPRERNKNKKGYRDMEERAMFEMEEWGRSKGKGRRQRWFVSHCCYGRNAGTLIAATTIQSTVGTP
jgi:hypothetical protein